MKILKLIFASKFIIKAQPQLLLLDKNEISSKNGKIPVITTPFMN